MRRSVMTWLAAALGFAVACTGDSEVSVGTRSDGVTVYCNIGEYYYVCTPQDPISSSGDGTQTGGGEQPCNPDSYPCPTGTPQDPTSGEGGTGGTGTDGGGGGTGTGTDGGGGTTGTDGGGGGGTGTDGGGGGTGTDGGGGGGTGTDGGGGGGTGTDGGGGGDGGDACTQPWPAGTATILWPPNHKMHTYTLADCGKVDVCPNGQSIADGTVTKITVDEEIDVGKGGDGHTTHYDAAILDATHFELRSERQGGMDGRVYTVYFVDANGDAGSCQFLVPHNRGPHEGAVDSGTKVTILP